MCGKLKLSTAAATKCKTARVRLSGKLGKSFMPSLLLLSRRFDNKDINLISLKASAELAGYKTL